MFFSKTSTIFELLPFISLSFITHSYFCSFLFLKSIFPFVFPFAPPPSLSVSQSLYPTLKIEHENEYLKARVSERRMLIRENNDVAGIFVFESWRFWDATCLKKPSSSTKLMTQRNSAFSSFSVLIHRTNYYSIFLLPLLAIDFIVHILLNSIKNI